MKALLGVVLTFACSALFAQTPGNVPAAAPPNGQNEIRDKYHAVEVDLFTVQQGVDFPPENLRTLQAELSRQLADGKLFDQVLQPGQQPTQPNAPIARLAGAIHNYNEGSRTKRYIAGFGPGAAEMDVQVTLLDAGTGQPLVIEEVRAMMLGGVFGGSADKAPQEFARQIVTQAKLMLVKRVPAPGEVVAIPSPSKTAGEAVNQQKWTMDAKDWSGGEQKLNQEAAAGYRVMTLSLTGSSTAELEMEKVAAPPNVYQYRWIHMRLASRLQKDVSAAAADGFHVCAHTLATLGPYLTVLMEKPPAPLPAPYQYLVSEPLRMANAQKDIESHQREGYALLDELEFGLHILLFEKAPAEMNK